MPLALGVRRRSRRRPGSSAGKPIWLMTPSSYSACCGGARRGRRPGSAGPARARPPCAARSPRSRPSGTGNRGIRLRLGEHVDVADPLGDQQRVVAGLRPLGVRERGRISCGGLEVVAAAVELEPVRVGHRRAGCTHSSTSCASASASATCSASRWWPRAAGRARWPMSEQAVADPLLDARGRGPSARGRSCPRRRCRGTPRPPRAPRRTGRAAAGSAPRRTGSRWWR